MHSSALLLAPDAVAFARFEGGARCPRLADFRIRRGRFGTTGAMVDGVRYLNLPRSSRTRLTLVVPDLTLLAKTVVLPLARTPEAEEANAAKVADAIPCSLDEVVWDFAPVGSEGVERTVAIVATPRGPLADVCVQLSTIGVFPRAIGAVPMLEATAWRADGTATEGSTLLVHTASCNLHLTAVHGEDVFLRSAKVGSHEGEHGVRDARLIREVERSLAGYRLRYPERSVSTIVLTGTAGPGFQAALSGSQSLPVHQFSLPASARTGAAPEVQRPDEGLLASLYGAALASRDSGHAEIDLLPATSRRQREGRERNSALTVGAGLLVLAGFVGLLGAWREQQWAERTLEEARGKVAPVVALGAAVEAEVDAISVLQAQRRQLEFVQASRGNWSSFLADLQSSLVAVEDVWIDRLEPMTAAQVPSLPGPASIALDGHRRLALSGRMIDREHPLQHVSDDMQNKVSTLFERFTQSEFVTGLGDARFDTSEKGILRFSVILILNPERPL